MSVRVIGQDATTSGLTLGTGLVEFTDLELIGRLLRISVWEKYQIFFGTLLGSIRILSFKSETCHSWQ